MWCWLCACATGVAFFTPVYFIDKLHCCHFAFRVLCTFCGKFYIRLSHMIGTCSLQCGCDIWVNTLLNVDMAQKETTNLSVPQAKSVTHWRYIRAGPCFHDNRNLVSTTTTQQHCSDRSRLTSAQHISFALTLFLSLNSVVGFIRCCLTSRRIGGGLCEWDIVQ